VAADIASPSDDHYIVRIHNKANGDITAELN
jgi:hypothetical protein